MDALTGNEKRGSPPTAPIFWDRKKEFIAGDISYRRYEVPKAQNKQVELKSALRHTPHKVVTSPVVWPILVTWGKEDGKVQRLSLAETSSLVYEQSRCSSASSERLKPRTWGIPLSSSRVICNMHRVSKTKNLSVLSFSILYVCYFLNSTRRLIAADVRK